MDIANARANFDKYWQRERHTFLNFHMVDSAIIEFNGNIYALMLADVSERRWGCAIYILKWIPLRDWTLQSTMEMRKLYPLAEMHYKDKAIAKIAFEKMKLKLCKPECDNVVDYMQLGKEGRQ